MKREIYEELKLRIWLEDGHWRFDNAWLNEGLSEYDEDYIDCVIHEMESKNIWNVCQRFYSFLKYYPRFTERLLANKM